MQDINFCARANAATWRIDLAIYDCDASGVPGDPVWNGFAETTSGSGVKLYTATVNQQLPEGTYQMCWKAVSGSLQRYYVVGTNTGVIKRGSQADLTTTWVPTTDHDVNGKQQFWCNCLEEDSGNKAPDKGPFVIKQSPDGIFYTSNPDGDFAGSAKVWLALASEFALPNYGRPDNSVGYPLPFVASWNSGRSMSSTTTADFSARVQAELTDSGEYFLPRTQGMKNTLSNSTYWGTYLERINQYDAPLFIGYSEPAHYIRYETSTTTIPKATNPLAYDLAGEFLVDDKDGRILDIQAPDLSVVYDYGQEYVRVQGDPFADPGSLDQDWIDGVAQVPNVSRVFWMNNNENGHLKEEHCENSERWMATYGDPALMDKDTFNETFFKDNQNVTYEQLHLGVLDKIAEYFPSAIDIKMPCYNWGKNLTYRQISWSYSGNDSLGIYDYRYSFPASTAISPDHLYYNNWEPFVSDTTVGSIQCQASNTKFILDQWLEAQPDGYLELSTWMQDHVNDGSPSLIDRYQRVDVWNGALGVMTYERYGASVMYGAWLVRPRVLREFIPAAFGTVDVMPALEPLLKYVKAIHENDTLRRFWRNGENVENANRVHPYNNDINKYGNSAWTTEPRWWLLDTNYDSETDWTYLPPDRPYPNAFWGGIIPVFAIALKLGTTPNQEWLVYCSNPMNDKGTATLTVPGFRDITVSVSDNGRYYLCKENGDSVEEVVWQ